jgi:phospholipase C
MVDGAGIGGFSLKTIYENLDAANVSWAIYVHDVAQSRAIRSINARSQNLLPFDAFLSAARSGTLPSYSFIEPRYFNLPLSPPANDMHPSHDVRNGERLIAQVYDALRAGDSAQWQSTLLVVVFDEHGGFFDHVPPLAVIRPDANVATNGFAFDRLGVRVPAILVSPLMPATVVKTIFDHTSILATVKKVFNLPSFLTARDAAANSLEALVVPLRPDASLPRNLSLLCGAPIAAPATPVALSDYQRSLVNLASVLHMPSPTGP